MVRALAALVFALAMAACLPNGPPTGLGDGGAPAATTPKKKPPPPPRASGSGPSGAADPLLTEVFEDEFERGTVGADWRMLGPYWRIQDGKLCGQRAKNRGIWLAKRIPTNARIEVEATAQTAEGDLKMEVWGDGVSGATGNSYTNATSYLAIYGGWKNTVHELARLDEHGADRKTVKVDPTDDDPRTKPVSAGQAYRFRIERKDGKVVSFYVDDVLVHRFVDESPLEGAGHDHVGFNDWEAAVCFDHLRITPLPG